MNSCWVFNVWSFTSVNSVHNAPVEFPPAQYFPARAGPPPASPPRLVLHRALPSPTPQNTPQGMGSDWKNLLGTAHIDRQCCFNI